jgi:hypothetical protein
MMRFDYCILNNSRHIIYTPRVMVCHFSGVAQSVGYTTM